MHVYWELELTADYVKRWGDFPCPNRHTGLCPEPLQAGQGGEGKLLYDAYDGYTALPVLTDQEIDRFHRRDIRRNDE